MKFSLEDILKAGEFTAAEVESVKKGNLVKGVLDSLSERELAVKFAFSIKSMDVNAMEEAFMESTFKKDTDPAVAEVGRLIDAADSGDAEKAFATLQLAPNTAAALKLYHNAAPGDDLNLSQAEIDAYHKLGKKATQDVVEKALRQQLYQRYTEYRELGTKGIAPYQRSRGKKYEPGEELQHKTSMMKFCGDKMPDVYKYLVEYPAMDKPEGLVESFSWTNTTLDDLPTFALVHKVGYHPPADSNIFVFIQRMFYVSRSHNSVQGAGGFFPLDDDTSVIVYGTRTSTDKVTGFGGAAKRTIGARIMSSKQAENFERVRAHAAKQSK